MNFGESLKIMIEKQLAYNLATYEIDIVIEGCRLHGLFTKEQLQKIYSYLFLYEVSEKH